MEGALKVSKKPSNKNTIQEIINKKLRLEIIPEAFVKKSITTAVKNTYMVLCPKCYSDNVNVTFKQTRSIDEATNRFYLCLRCGNRFTKPAKIVDGNYEKTKEDGEKKWKSEQV